MEATQEVTEIVNNNQDVLNGLRNLVEWLESHPECPDLYCGVDLYHWSKGDPSEAAKALGTCKKEATDYNFILRKGFATVALRGRIDIQFVFNREETCEKIITKEVKTVKELTSEAAARKAELLTEMAMLEQVEVEKEVEVVSWKCPESVLKPKGGLSATIEIAKDEEGSLI